MNRLTVELSSGLVSQSGFLTVQDQIQKSLCPVFCFSIKIVLGTAVAQWLRCCATNRKVAGSIPAGVSGFFFDIKILPIALWPWG